jgi:DNA-binding Lrp family transcriptional regulator
VGARTTHGPSLIGDSERASLGRQRVARRDEPVGGSQPSRGGRAPTGNFLNSVAVLLPDETWGRPVSRPERGLQLANRATALPVHRRRTRMLSQRGMLTIVAYVLIQAQVGQAGPVGQAIAEVHGVRSADVVTGPYDAIARVEAADTDELGKLVLSSIQAVLGVVRTLTCTIVRL